MHGNSRAVSSFNVTTRKRLVYPPTLWNPVHAPTAVRAVDEPVHVRPPSKHGRHPSPLTSRPACQPLATRELDYVRRHSCAESNRSDGHRGFGVGLVPEASGCQWVAVREEGGGRGWWYPVPAFRQVSCALPVDERWKSAGRGQQSAVEQRFPCPKCARIAPAFRCASSALRRPFMPRTPRVGAP